MNVFIFTFSYNTIYAPEYTVCISQIIYKGTKNETTDTEINPYDVTCVKYGGGGNKSHKI